MQKILLPVIAVCFSIAAYGQGAKGTVYQAKLAGTNDFKNVDDKYNVEVLKIEAVSPDGDDEKIKLAKIKAEIARLYPHKISNARQKTTAAQDPVVDKSFQANVTPGTPPDNDFAVSKEGKALSVINVNAAVVNANTGAIVSQEGLPQFSSGVKLSMIGNKYDPKVIYDAEEDRFICVMLHDRDADNYVVVGFSQSNDLGGTWAWYKFYGDYKADNTWFDYPGVSITKTEFFLTGNKIKFAAPWETGFSETVIYQISKSDGYSAAATLNYKIWDGIQYGGSSIRNLFPVRPGISPEGDEQYFVSNRNFSTQNDTIFLVKVPGTIAQGGNISVTMLKSPLSYGVPPNGRQDDTATLATNDGRILGAYAMYDEIQFVSTSVNPANGAASVFHAKITDYKTSPSISHAQFFSIDTLDFGYPNISFAGNPWGLNQSIISFNYTGPNTYAGMGAILYDGLSYSNLVKVKEGDGTIILQHAGKAQRWGDYTATQVDYNATGSVWIEGIYGRSDHEYGSWVAKLNSPVLSVKEQTKAKPKSQIYPNPAKIFVSYLFTLDTETEVTFAIYSATGQLVDELVTKKCTQGKNLIQFSTVSLPVGNYILKGSSATGDVVMTERFIKQ